MASHRFPRLLPPHYPIYSSLYNVPHTTVVHILIVAPSNFVNVLCILWYKITLNYYTMYPLTEHQLFCRVVIVLVLVILLMLVFCCCCCEDSNFRMKITYHLPNIYVRTDTAELLIRRKKTVHLGLFSNMGVVVPD